MSACTSPILNFRVRFKIRIRIWVMFRFKIRVTDVVMVGIVLGLGCGSFHQYSGGVQAEIFPIMFLMWLSNDLARNTDNKIARHY